MYLKITLWSCSENHRVGFSTTVVGPGYHIGLRVARDLLALDLQQHVLKQNLRLIQVTGRQCEPFSP